MYDQDDYFWSGIQPISLWNAFELELRSRELWTDWTVPLLMERVIEVATEYLNHNSYQPRGRRQKDKPVSSHGKSR